MEDKISKRIKALLKDLGLKQAHLADRLGVSVQYLSKLLITGVSTSKYLAEIANALDVTQDFLLTGNDKPVLLLNDNELNLLIDSNFSLPESNMPPMLNLLVKSESKTLFFAYVTKIAIDEFLKKGDLLVYSTKIASNKFENKIYLVKSPATQSFVVGKYISENHCLVNEAGKYFIQNNDSFVGIAVQSIVYFN